MQTCQHVLLFPAYFRLSPLQKHVRKVVGGFGKKSCVSTGVRKPGNMCVTDRHDMTLAVKVALNPNTTNNQPTSFTTHHVLFPWSGKTFQRTITAVIIGGLLITIKTISRVRIRQTFFTTFLVLFSRLFLHLKAFE